MKNKIIFFILILIFLCFAEVTPNTTTNNFYFNYKGSNKNFTFTSRSMLDRNPFTYNYNRLRTDLDLGWENLATFKIIFDLENYLGKSYLTNNQFKLIRSIKFDQPFDPYHDIVSENTQALRSYLYRAYGTFYLPRSTLVLGYQRIPLGVGRLWNPTDIINPFNPLSIESGERLGAYGALFTYNIDDLSQFKTFMTKNKYSELRDYGYILRSNYDKYDLALSYIGNSDTKLTGLEIERELLDTGIELRSEGAFIDSRIIGKKYQKYILGLDYGFPNSTYLVIEYLFNEAGATDKSDYELTQINPLNWEQLARNYLGSTISYEFTPLFKGSASVIINLCDGSFFGSPAVAWSLTEDMDLNFGTSFYQGSKYSEFWYYQSLTYFSVSNYF